MCNSRDQAVLSPPDTCRQIKVQNFVARRRTWQGACLEEFYSSASGDHHVRRSALSASYVGAKITEHPYCAASSLGIAMGSAAKKFFWPLNRDERALPIENGMQSPLFEQKEKGWYTVSVSRNVQALWKTV